MRELNVMEIDAVSGAGFWDAITSGILGGVSAGLAGAIIGGVNGGNGGGILGIGSIGQLVGMIGGGLIGVAGGAIAGAVVGYSDPEAVTSLCTQFYNNVSSGTFYK